MPRARPLPENVREYIRREGLVHVGDRVGVAVSGGADSVALLRLLLELRGELGVVLSVVHFHHGIRGAEAGADRQFVTELAAAHGLELRGEAGDSPAHAASQGLSLETAARDLRYKWFRHLLSGGVVNRVATAHTLDDQAETVLMRTLRGAGSRGMAGIYPELAETGPSDGSRASSIIRPLLRIRRSELVDYLRSLGQPWRDDQSNLDTRHLRNRIRHQLVPLLERDFNPQVADVLAHQAEIARAEEAFWQEQVSRLLPGVLAPTASREGAVAIKREALLAHPLARRRRLLRAAAQAAGLQLEFGEVEDLLRLAAGTAGGSCSLPQGWRALRRPRELRLEKDTAKHTAPGQVTPDYEYRLSVPGEVQVAEIGSVIRASLIPAAGAAGEYNALLPDAELVVRNWRAGDRFQPAHTRSPKKVKTLLQERRVALGERRLWPVVLSGATIIWMRGFSAPAPVSRFRIEEVTARETSMSPNRKTRPDL
ncbi:MAG: tRNA lysidine(34) synthetase TilS [Terriglobales bacterium]